MRGKRRSRYVLLAAAGVAFGLGAVFAPVLSRLDYTQLPRRASWQLPERVIEALDLRPGDVVADIGAGSGYFTFRLADAVGAEGRVYAVEIDEQAVRELRRGAEARGHENVEVVLGEPDDPALPDGTIDLAFLCNVYHHIDDRMTYFERLRQDLASEGRVAVVDVRRRLPFRWLSPPGHATSAESLRREMESAGYRIVSSFDVLPIQNLVIFSPE